MDDEALLQAWTEGDQKAGETLFGHHFDALYRFFRTKAPYDYEDLIQTTMLECVRSREKIRSGTSFRPFLFGVARNCLLRLLRSRYRDRLDFDALESSVAALDPRPSSIVAHDAEHHRLFEALRQIPVDLQVVLELHYWEDMGTRELATVLEIPQGTVKSRLRRGREALREVLASMPAASALPALDEPALAQHMHALRSVLDEG